MKYSPRVVDLFAGPGGMGTGFASRFEVTEAVDHNRDACETYQHNHKETRVYCKNVEDMTFDRNDYEGIIGYIGGPPCQSFSVLNQRRYISPELDPRGRLIYLMLDIINRVRPQFCLIENVASIPLKVKAFAERYLTKSGGYKVVSRVVKAWDYGSVQIRRRWILTGCLDHAIYPLPSGHHRVAREILTNAPSEITPTPETLAAIQGLPAGKWVSLPGQSFKVYFVIDPARPLPAVVNPTKLRYVRPDRQGYLSMEELYRAQGFPKEYRFFGTLSSKGQQLANAVPVELAEAFAQAFYTQLCN